jgi:hypothetical protein
MEKTMSATKIQILGLAVALVLAACFSAPVAVSAATANDLRCRGCVGKSDIQKNAIRSSKVKDGQIRPRDLHATAKPTGVNFSEFLGGHEVASEVRTVRGVAIEAPARGYVVVNATWYYSGTTRSQALCYLLDEANKIGGPSSFGLSAGQELYREAAALTRTFEVPAGKTIFYLNCNDGGTDMKIFDISFNALFVPNRYETKE